jgi:pimeloyl-ACP methyl ester carboxylesterase
MSSEPVPYTIDIPQEDVDDLRSRLRATRWPEPMADDWSLGTAPAELRTLVEHWGGAYDWRSAESHLDSYPQVMVDVAGERVHAVRAGTPGATPLLLIHGWPDSFLRFDRALPLLAERFDIVVPSIPGYGFSDRPSRSAGPVVIAGQMAELMSALGLEQFMVHGADIGSQIAEQLTLQHPERVLALHLGDIPLRRPRSILPQDATDDELAWRRNAVDWELEEGAYSHLQRTKPQTLAAGLNDSPAGLASWIFEKFHTGLTTATTSSTRSPSMISPLTSPSTGSRRPPDPPPATTSTERTPSTTTVL